MTLINLLIQFIFFTNFIYVHNTVLSKNSMTK